jgi:predicted DNA-binding WGR domain protein
MSTATKTMIKAQGWTLEHKDAGHFKFYTALYAENGVVVYHWGKIGTAGQLQIFEGQTKTAALRKIHSKAAKGYEYIKGDDQHGFEFELEDRDLFWAVEKTDPRRLTKLYDRALRDPRFAEEGQSILGQYDAFLEKASNLMHNAATMQFDTVMNDFEELEDMWKEIEDRHSLAATTIGMTKGALARALASGKIE